MIYLNLHSFIILIKSTVIVYYKQLLNEVEQDMRNYNGRGLCYQIETEALVIPHIQREPNSIIFKNLIINY